MSKLILFLTLAMTSGEVVVSAWRLHPQVVSRTTSPFQGPRRSLSPRRQLVHTLSRPLSPCALAALRHSELEPSRDGADPKEVSDRAIYPQRLELARPYYSDLISGPGEGGAVNPVGYTWRTRLWRLWRSWRAEGWSAWIAFAAAGLVFDGVVKSWSSYAALRSAARAADYSSQSPPSPGAQVLECDVCESQVHPARGRGAIVVGSPSFRCPHCGADGSHFFDVDDMRDERAQRRAQRLKDQELEDLIDT